MADINILHKKSGSIASDPQGLEKSFNRGALTLPFFLTDFPDEKVDSLGSRYHIQRGHQTTKLTYRDLFQSKPFSLGHWVPAHLDRLATVIPGNAAHHLVHLRQANTLLPIYQQFGGERLLKGGQRALGTEDSYKTSLRTHKRGVTNLCMSCLVEDEEQYGTPYIHRAHQIPGVFACWKHESRLMDRCANCKCPFERPLDLILSPWRGCSSCCQQLAKAGLRLQEKASPIEIEFARFAKGVLDGAGVRLTSAQLTNLYRLRAYKQGFRRGHSNVNRAKLFDGLEKYYGADLFKKMDSGYGKGLTAGWFHIFNDLASPESPLNRHLMLSLFLFEDPVRFYEQISLAAGNQLELAKNPIDSSVKSTPYGVLSLFSKKRDVKKELFEKLLSIAQKEKFSVEQLWTHYFGEMKRLIRLWPGAVQTIEKRLTEAVQIVHRERKVRPISAELVQIDAARAEAIRVASTHLYSALGKPVRISKNALLKGASKKRSNWPNAANSPLAYAALEMHHESIWHFYARRLIWAMREFAHLNLPKRRLIFECGLEPEKCGFVYDFIMLNCTNPYSSNYSIIETLKRMKLLNDWDGPCPSYVFAPTGRKYEKKLTDGRKRKERKSEAT